LVLVVLARGQLLQMEHQATIPYLVALPQLAVAVEAVEHLRRMD
jgi:hypothetical protein